jgi:hypothetical protein
LDELPVHNLELGRRRRISEDSVRGSAYDLRPQILVEVGVLLWTFTNVRQLGLTSLLLSVNALTTARMKDMPETRVGVAVLPVDEEVGEPPPPGELAEVGDEDDDAAPGKHWE